VTDATATKPTTLRERLGPRVMGTQEYIGSQLFVSVVLQLVLTALIASLAVSRAAGHRLSATAVAAIMIGGPAFNTVINSLISFFGGARDVTRGMVKRDGTEKPSPDRDPLTPGALWSRALTNALIAAAWGAGLGFLAYAVLNNQQASYWLLFVGMLAAGGIASVVTGLIGQAQGIQLAFDKPASCTPHSARRRAWVELAPVALIVAILHSLASWVLFHDYAVHSQFGTHVLTEHEVYADVLTSMVLVPFLIAYLVMDRAGFAEARLGLVAFDDPSAQIPQPKALFGTQVFVYVAVAVLVIATPVAKLVTPEQPTLVHAMIVRGVLAGIAAWIAGAFYYLRAAGNAAASQGVSS
jgi:hypothetical protein